MSVILTFDLGRLVFLAAGMVLIIDLRANLGCCNHLRLGDKLRRINGIIVAQFLVNREAFVGNLVLLIMNELAFVTICALSRGLSMPLLTDFSLVVFMTLLAVVQLMKPMSIRTFKIEFTNACLHKVFA